MIHDNRPGQKVTDGQEIERPLIRLNGQEPLCRAIQSLHFLFSPFLPFFFLYSTTRRCRLPLLAFGTSFDVIAFHSIFRRNLVKHSSQNRSTITTITKHGVSKMSTRRNPSRTHTYPAYTFIGKFPSISIRTRVYDLLINGGR